uniref:Uncharacterized protein n=1 Tax=Panagrolaimus sp. JU765 TaxID=591449 RepID=A0AC34Q848_9BILA
MKTTDWISSKVLTFSIVNALTMLRKYNSNIVETFLSEVAEFSNKFSIFDKSSVFDAEIAIVLSLLVNDNHVGILNEGGLRILDYAFEK